MTDQTKATSSRYGTRSLSPPAFNPPPRTRPGPGTPASSKPFVEQTDATLGQAVNAPVTESVRSKSTKSKREKLQPTGDYAVGYARPPEHTRFQANNPGGPGRRKGSRSQDSILRKELEAKQTVRIDGRTVKLSLRELAVKLLAKKAFEKNDTKLLLQMIQYAKQLFPESTEVDQEVSASGDSKLDHRVLADLFSGLTMGEPAMDNANPLASLGIVLPDLRAHIDDGDWSGMTNDSSQNDDHAEDGETCDHQ